MWEGAQPCSHCTTHRQPLHCEAGPLQRVRDDEICMYTRGSMKSCSFAHNTETHSMHGASCGAPYRKGVFFFQILYSSLTRRSSTSSGYSCLRLL